VRESANALAGRAIRSDVSPQSGLQFFWSMVAFWWAEQSATHL
jgi:hypothetical protein